VGRPVAGFRRIVEKYPRLQDTNHHQHLGTLGSGNHFIEVCLDEAERVWFMLHSGSRGVGNAIGSTFIALAQADMRQHLANLPDRDLAYLEEGSRHFADYLEAVGWAQEYARCNRAGDDGQLVAAARRVIGKPFASTPKR
jgi:tRNA-splicing ligase RtcB